MIVGTKFRATSATSLWGGTVFGMNRTSHTLNCHVGSKFFCWGSYERQKLKLRKQAAWVTSLLDWNFLTSKPLKSMEWQSLGLFCFSKHVASHMWRKRRGTNTWKHISVLSGFHIHDLHKTRVIPESIIASLGEKGKQLYTPFVGPRLQMPRWCTHCFCICMQQPFFQFNSFNQSMETKEISWTCLTAQTVKGTVWKFILDVTNATFLFLVQIFHQRMSLKPMVRHLRAMQAGFWFVARVASWLHGSFPQAAANLRQAFRPTTRCGLVHIRKAMWPFSILYPPLYVVLNMDGTCFKHSDPEAAPIDWCHPSFHSGCQGTRGLMFYSSRNWNACSTDCSI